MGPDRFAHVASFPRRPVHSRPMSRRFHPSAGLLESWTNLVRRRAVLVVVCIGLAVAALGMYAAGNLGIDADTSAMLAEDLPWRQDAIAYERAYPRERDLLLCVIDGPTPESVDRARDALASALAGPMFASIEALEGHPFFQRHALLYLPLDELRELEARLSAMQPFIGRLSIEPGLAPFLDTLTRALGSSTMRDQAELGEIQARLASAMDAARDARIEAISWRSMVMHSDNGERAARALLSLTPAIREGGLAAGRQAIDAVRAASRSIEGDGVRVSLTGPLALRYEEFRGLARDSIVMGLVAFVLVAGLLYGALRSAWLVTASLLTVVAGLVVTSAFAAAAVGDLNLISVAFAAIFIGAAIDYPIHLGLRYRELAEGDGSSALARAMRDVGPSLFVCTLTTSLGLFAFLPTSFVGVAELGLIAGVGMFVGLVMSVTLFPALLSLRSEPAPRPDATSSRLGVGTWIAVLGMLEAHRHRRGVRVACLLLAIASGATAWWARFDADRLNLRDQGSESVRAMRDLIADDRFDPLSAVVLARDQSDAAEVVARLSALPEVRAVRTIESFVPGDQEAKLAIVDRLGLSLGLTGDALQEPPNETIEQRLDALRALRDAPRAGADRRADASALAGAAERLIGAVERESPDRQRAMLDALSASLLGEFDALLARLNLALEAQPVARGDLPAWLVERWVLPDGRYRVEALPHGDLSDSRELSSFVRAIDAVAPHATGPSVVAYKAGQSIVRAFLEALGLAMIAIVSVLVLAFRRVRAAGIVLGAVALASLLTLATSVVLGVPFNFANVIAVPLIVGMGVDSAVHMIHRARVDHESGPRLAHTATARGIVFSALTTIAGFAGLLFAGHRGTASMAHLLIPGIAFTAAAALVLVPALLPPRGEV